MTDRGPIESIANEIYSWPFAHHHDVEDRDWAQRILDALAADGYSVVKTEYQQAETWMGNRRCVDARRVVGSWEPVLKGSEDEQ